MISAMPALSSAPSRVFPEAVMMVLPVCSFRCGFSPAFRTTFSLAGDHQVLALVVLMQLGLHAGPGDVGRRVQVGDQGDGRDFRRTAPRDGAWLVGQEART